MATDARQKLKVFQHDARGCTSCHEPGLIHVDAKHGHAKPMLQKNPTGALGVLLIGEAPNWDDTYDPHKGHLTYDADTDPTGRFQRKLFVEEVGLAEHEIDDVLFTNAALCLPKGQGGKYPVTAKQMDLCRPWLVRLINDLDVKVVITMGATALRALDRVEKHDLTLQDAGKLHLWFGRRLLPLYHASALGRVSRPEAAQRQDIRVLRELLGR